MSDGVSLEPVVTQADRDAAEALWVRCLIEVNNMGDLWSAFAAHRQAAVAAERARIEGFLQNPAAVHVNLLRGGIARPSAATIWHIYGRQLLDAMPAEFAAIEGTDLESPCHG